MKRVFLARAAESQSNYINAEVLLCDIMKGRVRCMLTTAAAQTLPRATGLAFVKRFKLYNYMRIKYKLSSALNSQIIILCKPRSAPWGEPG